MNVRYGGTVAANDDVKAALVALGLVGLGAAGYIALSAYEQRRQFDRSLRSALAERGIGLVAAELGRSDANAPVWFVTVNDPWIGVQQYSVAFPGVEDPYHLDVLQQLIARLFAVMPRTA